MEDSQLMGMLVQSLYTLEAQLIIGNVELFQKKSDSAEHLLQSVIGNVVVDQIQDFESRCKVFGDVIKHFICYFAAVELKMFEVGVCL